MDLYPFCRQACMGSLSFQGDGEQILKEDKTDQEKRSLYLRLPCMEIRGFCFLLQTVLVSVCGWLLWYRAGKAFKMCRGKLKQSPRRESQLFRKVIKTTVEGKPVYAQ